MRENGNKVVDLKKEASKQAVRDILCEATSSSVALGEIYCLRKKESKALSYAYLAGKLAHKSRGYIADLINGKRRVPVKLAQPLAQALGLELAAQEYFAALVASEHAEAGPNKDYWLVELEKLKKFFAMNRATVGELRFSNMYFAFEVFCSLSLYGENCTQAKLLQHFGEVNALRLREALEQLQNADVIQIDNEKISLGTQHLKLTDQDRLRDLINFIREGLRRAQHEVYKWFQRPKEAFFDSTIISVDRTSYEEKLPHMIKEIEKLKADIESETANELVQFNVQVFPLKYDN